MQNSGDQRREIAKLYPTWPRSASLPAVTVAVRLKAVLMILELTIDAHGKGRPLLSVVPSQGNDRKSELFDFVQT